MERGDCSIPEGAGEISIWFTAKVEKEQDLNNAAVAQLVERFLGKDEVMGSNPISS